MKHCVAPCWLLFYIFFATVQPAAADWQYTRWGMPAEELETLGRGNITRVAPARQNGLKLIALGDALLESGYKAEDVVFTAIYYFSDDKLVAVSLKTESTVDGIKTRDRLEAIYGKPDRNEIIAGGMKLTRWRSERDNNMITFYYYSIDLVNSMYEVRYQPIPSAKGGL